jgi:hypothetical protein
MQTQITVNGVTREYRHVIGEGWLWRSSSGDWIGRIDCMFNTLADAIEAAKLGTGHIWAAAELTPYA